MRAIIRITAEPQGHWGSNGSLAQDSRCFTYYILNKIREALPDYTDMLVVVGVEDTDEEARMLLQQTWIR